MTHHARILTGLLTLLVWAGVAEAAAQTPANHYDRVHFQASSSMAVSNDTMQALLVVQGQDRDPARLADRINGTMQWALEQARKHPHVKVQSEGYRIVPVYHQQVQQGWRASQGLSLESARFKDLAALIGELQSRLRVQSIHFSVSPQRRREVENRLISGALAAFAKRAGVIRKDLGASAYRIVELHINTGGNGRRPVPMMATRESVSSPALQAGTSRFVVTVDGVIELARR